MKGILLVGSLLLFCKAAFSTEWLTLPLDSLRVFFPPGQEKLAHQAAEEGSRFLNELVREANLPKTAKVAVFLVSDEETWDRLLGSRFPRWFPGVTRPASGRVYLRMFRQEQDWRKLLRHELVHAFLGMHLPAGTLPKWFEEGLAMLVAGENFADFTPLLSRASLTGSILSLKEIDQVISFGESKAKLAYAESFLCTKLIADALGREALFQVVRRVHAGEPFSEVFQDILEMDEADFQEYAFQYIAENYRWNFLYQSELFWWLILPALVLAAFLISKIRGRRTLKRWELEEAWQVEAKNESDRIEE